MQVFRKSELRLHVVLPLLEATLAWPRSDARTERRHGSRDRTSGVGVAAFREGLQRDLNSIIYRR